MCLYVVLVFGLNPDITEDEEVQSVTVSLVEGDLGNLTLFLSITINENTSNSTGTGFARPLPILNA